MQLKIIEKNQITVAVIHSADLIITDVPSALDFIMSVKYQTDSCHIALNKEAILEDFFRLSTCLAGEILQKFINYRIKFAVYGDFSGYTSKPLKDFIYECNQGKDIFFTATRAEAVDKLAGVLA